MRKKINLDGIWGFTFSPDSCVEDITIANLIPVGIMTVPGCYEALKKYFGRRGTGIYFQTVECGGSVKLRINALGLRGRVFWDDQDLGICEHAFSPEEFLFQAGERKLHKLLIAVENIHYPRESGQMFVSDYDFYGYGGIYDSVTITELPEYYLERVQVTPLDLEGNVRIKLITGGMLPDKYLVKFTFDETTTESYTFSGTENELICKVPNPKKWSLESPNLHHLRVELVSQDMLDTTFGIRMIEAKNGRILLNHKPIRLIGYNRHDSHPEFGYALPDSLMLADLQLIKDQGSNFVRGCHYPQREKFLNLCDRIGILVWEEVLGWNNQPVQCAHPDFIRREVEQAAIMVHKSANHPSVIMWGFLNEVYMPEGKSPRPLIEQLVNTLRHEDPSRLITFALATSWLNQKKSDNCLDLVDVISFNTYPGWYDGWNTSSSLENVVPVLRELAEKASTDELKNKPLLISEIGGAAIYGNHDDYRWGEEYQAELIGLAVNEIFDNPRYSGIAIWHFCDAKTHIYGAGFLNRPRGFNNKGLLDEYRRPKAAWHRMNEILRERDFDGFWK